MESSVRRDVIGPLLLVLAAAQIGVGAWLLIDPEGFFDSAGPFGVSNPHYTRDAGTFTLALGVALVIAYARPSWRLGVVGYAFFQSLLHSINHLVDIDEADPEKYGPIDFAALAVGTVVFGWMLVRLLRDRRAAVP